MALLIDPPPLFAGRPGHTATRWPLNKLDHGGSTTITVNDQGPGLDILGHSGNPPTPAQYAAFSRTMFNTPPSGSFPDAYGSWVNFDWDAIVGRGLPWRYTPTVLYEFRSAADVAAMASTTHHPFAVTVQGAVYLDAIPAGQPPVDGLSAFGGGGYVAADWPEQPFIRVLLSEDILTAVGPFGGEQFLIECIQHETGHVVQVMLRELYGDEYLRKCSCDIFGRPESDWNPAGAPWQDRVIEASAEVFKDIMLPGRKYDNRTSVQLPDGRLSDFEKLYIEYAETSYWGYENTFTPPYRWLSYAGYGDAYTWTDGLFAPSGLPTMKMLSPAEAIGLAPFYARNSFVWPPEGDHFHVHWNFDWSEFSDPTRTWAGMDPTYEAKVVLYVRFFPISYLYVMGSPAPGVAPLAEVAWEVNPADNPTGAGSLEIAWPAGLPDEGVVVQFSLGGPLTSGWSHPRPDSPPHADPSVLPMQVVARWVDDPVELAGFLTTVPFWRFDSSNDVTKPWIEWSGLRKNTFPRALPYNRLAIPGTVLLGRPAAAVQRPDVRMVSR